MIEGKVVHPAGSGREIPKGSGPLENLSKWFNKLRGLFHSAPVAMTGNSGKVMDHYMKYHREHCGD